MAELIWTVPALQDLDKIADYIALDDSAAAAAFVKRVFRRVEQLAEHPGSGSIPRELRRLRIYRQIVEPPCRIFYRLQDEDRVFIVHVMRGERLLRSRNLKRTS